MTTPSPFRTLAAVGVILLASAPVCASAATAAKPRPAAAAKPAIPNPRDFSGVWMNNAAESEQRDENGNPRVIRGERPAREAPPPPLTPEYMAVWRKIRDQEAGKGKDPSLAEYDVAGTTECKWPGMPTIMGWPFPLEFVHRPKEIIILLEADSQVRRVHMDGRKHPPLDELDPTYNGHSIGHWEGATLVIDTVGVKTSVLMNGIPHSDEARIVERLTLLDRNTLENQITITDPKALTAPVTRRIVYGHRDWELEEYSCAENNRNALDDKGVATSGIVEGGQ